MSNVIEGQCLCGAVTVTATTSDPVIRACHCDMCRRQTSSMFISVTTDPASQKVTGPVKNYRSSDWAQRGFCKVCGSTLWYQTLPDGARSLAAGLFANAGNGVLKLEFCADMCPQGYALSGDHERLTTNETIARFAPEDGEAQ